MVVGGIYSLHPMGIDICGCLFGAILLLIRKESIMMIKLRFYAVGMVAILLGIPLTEKAFGNDGYIVDAALSGAFAIAESAEQS